MKVLKHRNLMSLIYSLLLALPLCSILGRVLYVQWNKNAKESYSDNYTDTIYISSNSSFTNDNIYYFNSKNYVDNAFGGTTLNASNKIYFDDINVLVNSPNFDFSNVSSMSLSKTAGRTSFDMNFYDSENTLLQTYVSTTNYFVFNFKYVYNNLDNVIFTNSNMFYYLEQNNTLDNAFSYSVSQIIEDNNFGEINFVGLFDELFLDQTNSANALYLHFANWYMNYALFISLVFILFLVLMWFINFIRKMLEKGMDFGQRGY